MVKRNAVQHPYKSNVRLQVVGVPMAALPAQVPQLPLSHGVGNYCKGV
jgi:hypothetical protein